jgi:hypothetical protein
MPAPVLATAAIDAAALEALLDRFGVERIAVDAGRPIPGSYWGAPEAGLERNRLYLRPDTPVHSLLHELAHYVCMSGERRRSLVRDAGGDDDEEAAACYLQVLLADALQGVGRARCFDDMDAWGYSFREGAARAWFAGDGEDARRWLLAHDLIDAASRPTWRLRQ